MFIVNGTRLWCKFTIVDITDIILWATCAWQWTYFLLSSWNVFAGFHDLYTISISNYIIFTTPNQATWCTSCRTLIHNVLQASSVVDSGTSHCPIASIAIGFTVIAHIM